MKPNLKFRQALACGAMMGLLGSISPVANAAFVYTFDQVGQDVVVNGNGTVNTSGLSLAVSVPASCSSGITPSYAYIGIGGGSCTYYTGATGPAFGSSLSFFMPTSSSGSIFAASTGAHQVIVAEGYVSESAMANTMIFEDQTYASLGVTPGTYVWNWGSGINADTLTIQINAAVTSVPEPVSALLFGSALLGLFATSRRKSLGAN